MKEDLKSIGQMLKDRRMELNLSLKEAHTSTSIQLSHLEALEEGEIDQLISPVYAQGFLKQYAKFLGLDGDKIVRENPDLFQQKAGQEFDYGIGTMEMRGGGPGSVKGVSNSIWLAATVSLVIVAWLIARYMDLL